MRPQDPNFPSEIPPIPPPRHTDQSKLGDGNEPASPSFGPSAETEEESVLPQAVEGEVARLGSQDLAREDALAEPVVSDPSPVQTDAASYGPA